MTSFNSLVSKFAHEKNGESSQSSDTNGVRNSKKRTLSSNGVKPEDEVKEEEATAETKELTTQVRKSLRLSSTATTSPLKSRTISAESIKTRPHHKRTAVEVVKKEEETTVRVKTQGRNPGYAAPGVYAHLSFVPDIIDYDLDVLFVGINPGVKSSERSHHFAGPTNHFWPCLSESGLLPPGVRLRPDDDRSLPAVCNMGLSNLVDRPSRMGNELSVAECRAAAPILTAKIKKYRPRFVCFVSKQAWEMYAGVGLGLQSAWVSWHDEPEDEVLTGIGHDHDDVGREHAIQNNLDDQGYRLAPYFEKGPSAEQLEEQLAAEGAPSPFKREVSEGKSFGIKAEVEDEEKPIKAELDEDSKPDRMDIDDKNGIKPEQLEDVKVKVKTDGAGGESSGSGQSRSGANGGPMESRYRGGVRGSRMFVMPSTSGRVTQYRREDKLAYFKQLAELVRKDRRMRGVKAPWE
ncbi:hypothetical protein BC939DRAFT_501449 [Gamsiella multidivaricata]|uniref:uncharacterized protein n=1 Tax=Gamsiella multidivaricata TaxID=101098 RepID=UPI00222095ED|nr:uncharacterized protein BC939DRAFT_501449 [Gamsiella multidivaricata]KAG0359020.1 hypothetical protein BGZ54_010164 [Gamsiella multidivaricata]KAI7827117.1 hypothetical protein BC939DRAFT_501449 [Gamsiella multidivaricata]